MDAYLITYRDIHSLQKYMDDCRKELLALTKLSTITGKAGR